MSFALAHQSKSNNSTDGRTLTPEHTSSTHHHHQINNLNRNSQDHIFQLRRAIGNQVHRFRDTNTTGFDFAEIGIIQPKLKVNQPQGEYEQEADRVAEQIFRMSAGDSAITPSHSNEGRISTKCSACEIEEKEMQDSRKPSTASDLEANDEILEEINTIHSGGSSPLDASTKDFMESRFGYDFSNVRIYADESYARSVNSLNALAYTSGNKIVFGYGQYSPHTLEGRKLLAHELTHVIQQSEYHLKDTISRSPAEEEHGEGEGMDEAEEISPSYSTISVIWFKFDSDQPREDNEVSSLVHLAIALKRINDHALVTGEEQTIVLHGYASAEGNATHNLALSVKRAEKIQSLLIDYGIPAERISIIGHGEDLTNKARRWNRRVEIELKPEVTMISFSESESITGRVPRSGPMPLESTRNLLTPSHWSLIKREKIPSPSISGWDVSEAITMKYERMRHGKSKTLLNYKNAWVIAKAKIIRQAAAEHDIPDWFLAGIAWAEVGGDPSSIDYFAHSYRRDIGIGSKPAMETSFGAVSVQLRRAAEELGYDPTKMNSMQINFLIRSLEDPQQNLFIVASHLHRLRDIDFPGKPAGLLTDDELKIIGARYNRGPELSLEALRSTGKKLSHGEDIVKKKSLLQDLIKD
jgi:outer membrane protein OmpA-like peptidoglycan-associated protein